MRMGIIITMTGAVALFTAGMASGQEMQYDRYGGEVYRANELSLDAFGGLSLDKNNIDRFSQTRVRENGRLGAGVGVNYFLNRYIGVGAEGYTENAGHTFVDQVNGSLIVRFPLGQSGFAPYGFGGAGHGFDPIVHTSAHAGAGIEYRFSPNIGIFTDARYVWTDRMGNYGLGRLGVRFAL